MKKGKVIGIDNSIEHLDFSGLSESEKNKAIILLSNKRDYEFSVDLVDGKYICFITILRTGEKVNFVDYIKKF